MRELTLAEINLISGGENEIQIVVAGALIVVILVAIAGTVIYVCC